MNKPFTRLTTTFVLVVLFLQPVISQQTDTLYISGSYAQADLLSFFRSLESRYPVKFYYLPQWFAGETITLDFTEKPVREVVQLVLTGKPYTCKVIQGNQFVFLPKQDFIELTGQLTDYSNRSLSSETYRIVGDLDEAGSFRNVDITGLITDGETGEPIIGATVQIENMLQGAVSNTEGVYKLTLSPGLYTLIITSVGYENTVQQVRVVSSGMLNVELFDKSIAIEDVIIYGERLDRNVTGHQMSLLELDVKSIHQLPVISGGKDIIKGLTLMPGIKSVGEFSSGINVRGGGEDQNLYLINGAPLFNTSHVFGLFSVVNPDMVDKLTLYKGHIPADYGERVSSVIDIRTRETIPESRKVKGGIGLYDSKLMMELPVVKDKAFLNLGGRSSYSNWILKNINDADLSNSNAFFYDLNGTLNVNLNKNRFMISAYSSYDDFTFNNEIRYAYGSNAGSAAWNYIIGTNLASYFTLIYSRYNVLKDDLTSDFSKNRIRSGTSYTGLRYRLKYSGISKNVLDIGFNAIRYSILPGKQNALGEKSLVRPAEVEPEKGVEGAVYINDEITLSSFLTMNAGIRASGYAYLGPKTVLTYLPDMSRDSSSVSGQINYGHNEIIHTYFALEPRVSVKIQFNHTSSLKLSFDRNLQYLSLISNSSVSTPGDVWKLSDAYIRPLIANQFAIGYYRNFMNNTIEMSAEVYYKNLNNVIEYKNGVELEMIDHIESQLINAKGRNYGVELLLKKNTGTFEGWITYTFSRSLRKTTGSYPEENINNGRYFPSSYDKPHDFTVVANYHMNKRLSLSANFTYTTGRPVTLPEYKYVSRNEYVVFFSDKNKYRIPSYHRLDITLRYDESLRIRKKWKGSWSFSILNVYGRKNAYTVFYKEETPSGQNDYNRFSLYKLYLIGRPVPTITYNFIF
ncbi:MAG: TonB-dependent receptor [Bacteroidales bacterium]|nr:TonB-dependent receptor [Bacteroidales bacterium]